LLHYSLINLTVWNTSRCVRAKCSKRTHWLQRFSSSALDQSRF